MSIFRRRLLANQQLLGQDPLSHHGHPEPLSEWVAPTEPSLGDLPMARRWFSLPWGCRDPAPHHRDLQLCSGTGSCYRVLPPALTAPPSMAWEGVNGKETLPEHL